MPELIKHNEVMGSRYRIGVQRGLQRYRMRGMGAGTRWEGGGGTDLPIGAHGRPAPGGGPPGMVWYNGRYIPDDVAAAEADAANQQQIQNAQIALQRYRAETERLVAEGNISIAEANNRLQTYIANLNAKVNTFRAETERQLGMGELDLGRAKIASESRGAAEESRVREKLGMAEIGSREKLGFAELGEKKATRTGRESYLKRLLANLNQIMAGEGGGAAVNYPALEEGLYAPAQRQIEEQAQAGLTSIGGQAAGAGYGGRSSWEARQRAGIMGQAAGQIGAVRAGAGVQATRIKLEEAERARANRARMAAVIASMAGGA